MDTTLIVLRPLAEPRTKGQGQAVRAEFPGFPGRGWDELRGAEEVGEDVLQGMGLELAPHRGQFWDRNNGPSGETL